MKQSLLLAIEGQTIQYFTRPDETEINKALTFAMHATDPHLPKGNGFISAVHRSSDILFGRPKGFGCGEIK
jgi:hypothetical protein